MKMAASNVDPRAAIAKMEAEEKAAAEALAALQTANATKVDALKKELREADLLDVKEKCKLHGFTVTDLRSVLKAKGARKTAARKSPARRAPAKKRTPKAK